MGFGFNLAFIFIIMPLLVILGILWALTNKKIFGKSILAIFGGIAGLILFTSIINILMSTELDKDDYYGTYTIDRRFFQGKQANWQYKSFRFEIKDNDSLYFYHTDGNRILHTYRGTITTVKPYNSERLVLHMEQPTHHIINDNPTTYRTSTGFYLVFNSEKFRNVFFSKGEWKDQEAE